MAVTLSPLTTNQSFGVWFDRTNQVLQVLSTNVVTTDTSAGGAGVSGNVNITGFLGATNIAATTLRGSNGSLGNTQTLVIASNVNINSAAYVGNSIANSIVGYNPTTNSNYSSNGNINSYLQTIIQNANGGGNASVDLVINSDQATDSTNYLDIGINSSGYNNSQFTISGALDAYLYSSNSALAIGTASAKPLQFFVNGTLAGNEVMRIDSGANVGIGTTTPNAKLQVNGTANVTGNVAFGANLAVFGTLTTNNLTVTTNETVGGNLTVTGVLASNTRLFIGNSSSNATVNSTVYSGTANNASNLGGTAAASYQLNSTLAANVATLTANNTSFVGSVTAANVVSNSQLQANIQYFVNTSQLSANLANYQTSAGMASNVAVLTSNNTSFVGTVTAANVVSNAQLQANIQYFVNTAQLSSNLANYTTTAGLAGVIAINTANNTSFVGTVTAANVVSNAQLQANIQYFVNTSQLSTNLANYQTTAGLAANVAVLTSNNTSFVGSVTAANVVSNAQLVANLANYSTTATIAATYQTAAGLASNVAVLTSNSTNFVGTVSAANVVSNAQLSANLSNYQTSAGLSANIAAYLPTYTGVVNATSFTTTRATVNSVGIAVTNASGSVIVANSLGVFASANLTVNTFNAVGAANIANNLNVTGTVVVGGDLAVSGTLTYTGTGTASIIPNANNAYTLGNTSLRWLTLYSYSADVATTLNVGGAASVNGSLTVNGSSLSVNGSISSTGTSIALSNAVYSAFTYSVPSQAVPNTNIQTADYYDAGAYRSSEYLIQIAANTAPGVTNYHTTKILVMHDGVSAYTTEFGSMYTGSSLATFQADIGSAGGLSGQLRLRMTPLNTNVVAKIIRNTLTV